MLLGGKKVGARALYGMQGLSSLQAVNHEEDFEEKGKLKKSKGDSKKDGKRKDGDGGGDVGGQSRAAKRRRKQEQKLLKVKDSETSKSSSLDPKSQKKKKQKEAKKSKGETLKPIKSGLSLYAALDGGGYDNDDDSDNHSQEEEEEEDYESDREEEEEDDDDDDDDDNDDDGNDSSDEDAKPAKRQSLLKGRKQQAMDTMEDSFSTTDLERSVMNILDMKEIEEITAPSKAALLLSRMISPLTRSEFYKDCWEKTTLHSSNATKEPSSSSSSSSSATSPCTSKRFKGLFSTKAFARIIKEHTLNYDMDIRVSKLHKGKLQYLNGVNYENNDAGSNKRDNHSNTKKSEQSQTEQPITASAREVFKSLSEGCTLRLNCPQQHNDNIWKLLSCLEMEFGNKVGCHATLMPVKSESDVRRYETWDTFICQVEGVSVWRLYPPTDKTNQLPRQFMDSLSDMSDGRVVESKGGDSKNMQLFTLQPGDILYFPKGWWHEEEADISSPSPGAPSSSSSLPDVPLSLHLSITSNETHTVADYLELLVPQALQALIQEKIETRVSVPRNFSQFMGVASSENDTDKRRKAFHNTVKKSLAGLAEQALDSLDAAADQMTKQFIVDRLPVPLTEEDSAVGSSELASSVQPFTQLRMLRPGIACAVIEDGMVILYHCMDNARDPSATTVQPLEFELDDGPAIEALLQAYPDPVTVSDLPHPSEELEDKVDIARSLFKEGFLVIVDHVSKSDSNKRKDGKDDDGSNAADDDDDPF